MKYEVGIPFYVRYRRNKFRFFSLWYWKKLEMKKREKRIERVINCDRFNSFFLTLKLPAVFRILTRRIDR